MSVDNVEITAKKSVTYLGCTLDNTLSGENMALKVLSKINQRTKVLAGVSSLIDRNALKTLAGALVQRHFDYAFTSWYTSIPKTCKRT